MQCKLIVLLFSLLLFKGSSSPCPLNQNLQSRVYSDSVALTAQDNGQHSHAQNLVYNYMYDHPFSKLPNIALGLNEIQGNESPYLDIQVNTAKVTQNSIYFQAQSSEQSKWRNFKVNFLATNRDDIEIGVSSIQNPTVSSTNSFDLSYDLKGNFATNGLKVKSFLRGLAVESQNKQKLGFKQKSGNIVGNKIYFTFSNIQRVSIIHSVALSIIVFNMYSPGVLYADGIIDQNFVVSRTEITIPKHGINELRTYIVGINSFHTSAAQPLSISTAIDETFKLVIGPIDRCEIDYISVSYLVLSIVDCGACSGFPLLYDGLCKKSCPVGTKSKNGQCIPIKCTHGYQLGNSGQCIPICGQNMYYDGKVCVCKEGFHNILDRCQKCKYNEYFDYKQVRCKNICNQNSYYSNGKCVCYEGFYLINSFCQKCPFGTSYSSHTYKCQQICSSHHQIYSPQGCVCQNGYHRIQGVCSRCPYQTEYNYNSRKCECIAGFQFVFGMCMPACKINQVRVNGDCTCSAGHFFIKGKCDKCPDHAYYDDKKLQCECKRPYMMMNNQCVPVCPRDHYIDELTQKCVPYCKQFYQQYINRRCVCHQDFERSNQGTCVHKCLQNQVRSLSGKCECIEGFFKGQYGLCQIINCPPGTVWNSVQEDCLSSCHPFQIFLNGRCTCRQGYTSSSYGNCIPECTDWQKLQNGRCVCLPNYYQTANGVCVPKCPSGYSHQYGKCICKHCSGNNHCQNGQVYNEITRTCYCPHPKVWVLGQCIHQKHCQSNQYWSGTKCVCNYGFYRLNGRCVQVSYPQNCPPNSSSNGVNCLCKPGFYPIQPGTCSQCPPNFHWDGRKCQHKNHACQSGYKWDYQKHCCVPTIPHCQNGQYWDGVTCRCNQGEFYIEGKCQQCPYGTFFDGVTCTQGNGYKCDDPYSFWNGERCVCIPNFYPLWNDKCVSCPSDTYWNGVCCKPNKLNAYPQTSW